MTTIPENRSADTAPAFPATVTVPRSPVPPGTDTPIDGHVPGTGTAGHGNDTVPSNGSGRRYHLFPTRKVNGNGTGTGNEERSPVPGSPVPADLVTADAEAVTDASPTDGETEQKPGRPIEWITVAIWSVIIVLNALALLLASTGQIEGTWKWAGLDQDDNRRFLLPAITEVGYLAFLLLGADALRRKQSPFPWWGCGAGVAGAAIFMNSVHGEVGFEFEQGIIFGVASGVSLALTFAKFFIDYRTYRQAQGHTEGLRPRAFTVSSVFFMPLAFRAHLVIARCEEVDTRKAAYELAELWRVIYKDTRKKENQETARRTAWFAVYAKLGRSIPELDNIQIRKVTFAEPPPPPPPPPPPASKQERREPAPAPAPSNTTEPASKKPPAGEAKISPAKPVPDHFWTDHAKHIAKVQDAIDDWATRDKAPTVSEVQSVIPNRQNAANTAACIRVLRDRARPARERLT